MDSHSLAYISKNVPHGIMISEPKPLITYSLNTTVMSSTRVPTGAFLLFVGIRWFPSIGSIWLFLGAFFLLNDISESNPLNTRDAVNTLAYVAVYSAAAFWQRLVGEIVPEPYLVLILYYVISI